MTRASFILLAALTFPACTLIEAGHAANDVGRQVSELAVGARCRVTLEPVKERAASTSQLTYEGTVEGVADDGLTLKDVSMVATSRAAPPIATKIPVIDRTFSSVTVVEQSLDAPVTIPVAKIEEVVRLDELAAATGN